MSSDPNMDALVESIRLVKTLPSGAIGQKQNLRELANTIEKHHEAIVVAAKKCADYLETATGIIESEVTLDPEDEECEDSRQVVKEFRDLLLVPT